MARIAHVYAANGQLEMLLFALGHAIYSDYLLCWTPVIFQRNTVVIVIHVIIVFPAASDRIRTPRAFMVSAGSEHERFVDLFPSWEVNRTVQELNCKV